MHPEKLGIDIGYSCLDYNCINVAVTDITLQVNCMHCLDKRSRLNE